jgi:hypothetical protein
VNKKIFYHFRQTGPVKPQFILWYRNDRIVEYDETIDAKVSIPQNFLRP